MGGNNSKLSFNVPSNIWCFPYFTGEQELLCRSRKASNSLVKVRNTLALISGMGSSSDQFAKATVFMAATTCLISFLSERLCKQNESSSYKSYPDYASTCNDVKTMTDNFENNNICSSPQPDRIQLRTLEDALIDVKINKAAANSAVSELHAKFVAIRNRYTRMVSEISLEDRRLEVVPALTYCEEILELFRDQGHIFWKNPLVSTPFLVTFAGIYISLADFAHAIIPSYKLQLVGQMILLRDILIEYKKVCIKTRQSAILIKSAVPDNICAGALMSSSDQNQIFYLEDNFLNKSPLMKHNMEMYLRGEPDTFKSYDTQKEAVQGYKEALEEKYDLFFEQILKSVMSFSGFDNNANSPSGQLNDDDEDGCFE